MAYDPVSPEHIDCDRQQVSQAEVRPVTGSCHVMTLSAISLFLISLGIYLLFALSSYREKYAQATDAWRLGGTRIVELTLVKQDIHNLSCASDQVREGLHCGYSGDLREVEPASPDAPQVLQPYNTVKNELLLGAGLWSNPVMKEDLPSDRFTVACNYHVVGIMKAVSLRWSPTGTFSPVTQSVTVGTLTECVLSR